MKIPFICVNYNGSEETIKYIVSVISLSQSDKAIVIVVDNSPTDDDYKLLKNFLEKEKLNSGQVVLLKTKNRGYFQGLNDGIAYANELGIKNTFFVVGNNDITFKKNFIEEIISYKLTSDILVIAPDVVTNNGSHENPHVLQKMGFLRKLKYDIYFSNYYVAKILSKIKSTEERPFKAYDSERKEIYMGIGALYILTPNFFVHFSKLSEEVFLYGEEALLTGQIKSVNGKIIYDPLFICYHNESATTSKLPAKPKYLNTQKSYKIYRKYL